MNKEIHAPNAHNYIATEVWTDHPDLTVVYNHLDGAGHTVTNHYSDTWFQVIDGEGELRTPQMAVLLQPGDQARIKTGVKHQILGSMTFFMTLEPGIHPVLITYGDQKLGRAEKKLLHRIDRAERKQTREEQRLRIFDEIAEKYIGKFDTMLALQYALNKDAIRL